MGQDLSYYKQVADTAQNPTIRLQALDSVLSKSFRVDNDVFVTYSEAYITLAKEIDIIEAAARKAMKKSGYGHQQCFGRKISDKR